MANLSSIIYYGLFPNFSGLGIFGRCYEVCFKREALPSVSPDGTVRNVASPSTEALIRFHKAYLTRDWEDITKVKLIYGCDESVQVEFSSLDFAELSEIPGYALGSVLVLADLENSRVLANFVRLSAQTADFFRQMIWTHFTAWSMQDEPKSPLALVERPLVDHAVPSSIEMEVVYGFNREDIGAWISLTEWSSMKTSSTMTKLVETLLASVQRLNEQSTGP